MPENQAAGGGPIADTVFHGIVLRTSDDVTK
jgi:hypothetical protein